MDLGLNGKVAVVAGSSRGLGYACASALSAEGAHVVLTGRSPESLAAAETTLADAGGSVISLCCDMTEPDAPGRAVSAAVDAFGRVDIVVANAGGPPRAHALEVDDAAIIRAVNDNFVASVRLARLGIDHMRQSGWGRVVCISSYTISQAIPALALSNSARAGLWAWIKTAAHDLSGTGITVNTVCPGLHRTERMVQLQGAARESSGDPSPIAPQVALGEPGDFGSVVAFVCSVQARFLNGAAIVVDGGATLAL